MKEKNTVMKKIVGNMSRVIVGKEGSARLMVIALASSGHVLIEDVPGIGKTTMANTMAKSVGLSFNRIQFTPDILPSDITGFTIFNQKTGEFEYRSGNIMSNVILADEINRTSPKTQASMLEVMEEKQVTVDGKTYKVPNPFMVIATQNPVEYMGTYPLPEAQMDRFMMKISMGYPSRSEEVEILYRFQESSPIRELTPVVTSEELLDLQQQAREVRMDQSLAGYIVDLITATRRHEHVMLGCSPRASISLFRASQAAALYEGRDYVIPEDIRDLAVHVLSHRLVLKQEAKIKRITNESIISEIIEDQKIPVSIK
ncbi:MAG: MoxR family ATPase [Clostridiaceae bacterium]|jgi:MoxR-like ATPase|nr:MoxR family ATPase [Bacillota bacterium]NLI38967.1 MoxR family ATPase [Clostridiaceae bacterium]